MALSCKGSGLSNRAPSGEEGVGISLELSQNGNAEALTSLWAASFHITDAPNETSAPNASAYQHLAVASAAWVDIWMTKALDGGALLTADPVSWAFFRSGVDAQRLGDRERAQVQLHVIEATESVDRKIPEAAYRSVSAHPF